jgi:hypothetical protein
LFSDQGKQTSVFRFYLKQTNGSWLFRFLLAANKRESPISISSVFRLLCTTKIAPKRDSITNLKIYKKLYEMYIVLSPKSRDPITLTVFFARKIKDD